LPVAHCLLLYFFRRMDYVEIKITCMSMAVLLNVRTRHLRFL
jgi:hypothetical protein